MEEIKTFLNKIDFKCDYVPSRAINNVALYETLLPAKGIFLIEKFGLFSAEINKVY